MMIKTTIIGASGYSGAELVKILTGHPDVRIEAITSTSLAGRPIADLYPNLLGASNLVFSEMDIEAAGGGDAVFLALPHGRAMDIVPELRATGAAKIIDLSGDFRLQAAVYEDWYKQPHGAPNLIGEAVYGLSELNADKIAGANLIANPGCFPTGVALAAAPLISAGAVEGTITANCLTGVSGAGRGASEATTFCRMNDNAAAYKIGGAHQHTPEIEQVLALAVGAEGTTAPRVSFTPVLAPVSRGIYSVVTAALRTPLDDTALNALYRQYYRHSPFVHVLAPGTSPQLKAAAGSNHCHIGVAVDKRLNQVTMLSAIDNLVKGAAGQAVQNMNIMFGLDETTGLKAPGLYP